MPAQIVEFANFHQSQSATIAEAKHGRFMIVADIETLDDLGEGLPDDVVAFAFRRMIRESRLGRALDDDEAAYKLHKHASTVQRFRRQHGEFVTLMDGISGHARHKFLTRKSAKSSNFRRPKPLKNCQSREPEEDPSGKNSPIEESSIPEGTKDAPIAAPCLEASTAPARREHPPELRTSPETPSPAEPPEVGPPAADEAPPTPEERTGYFQRIRDALAANRINDLAVAEAARQELEAENRRIIASWGPQP